MGLSCRAKSSVAVSKSMELPPAIEGAILQVFKYKDLESATGGFAQENLILKTNHGQTYRGTLQDGTVVAVKRPPLPSPCFCHDEDAFVNEMQILSKLFSRRLVNLLGYSQDGRVKLLVVEHMVNGTLHDSLHGRPDRALCLSWPVRVQLALQVAKAIRALHASSPPIVHGNIKSVNIFIDHMCNARLGDFSLASCVQDVDPPRRSNLSSIPEVEHAEVAARFSVGLEDIGSVEHETSSHISTKTDVFNFGMLLLEILTGRNAVFIDNDIKSFSLRDWALPLIKQGNAMAICDARIKNPEGTLAVMHMAPLAERCIRSSAVRRPSMDGIVQGLTKISKLLPQPTGGLVELANSRVKFTHECSQDRLMTSDQTRCNPTRHLRLPVWTGFLRLKRKKPFLYSVSKFLARKFKIGSSGYKKLPTKKGFALQEAKRKYSKGPLKGAKVFDEGLRDRSEKQLAVVDQHVHMKDVSYKVPRRYSKRVFSHHGSREQFVRIQGGPPLY